jgi:pyruvate formate lyase activating enzyme
MLTKQNSTSHWLNQPVIYDLTPFSLLDYPNHLAAIVWFTGCSMRCQYCYNPAIVLASRGKLNCHNILTFLHKRVNRLDAVVLSGGECSNFKALLPFCEKIKSLGFKIKLDTNGSNPEILAKLIAADVIDYIALDYKAPPEKFLAITGSNLFSQFMTSLKILIDTKVKFEVRTTVHRDLLDENDLNKMAANLKQHGYNGTFYLQKFISSSETLGQLTEPLHSLEPSLLKSEFNFIIR